MKYGAIAKAVLGHLAESGKDMVDAFLSTHHPKAKFTRTVLSAYDTRYSSLPAAKHALSATLSRLKKQGLVASTGPKKKTIWMITKEGREFLKHPPLRAGSNSYQLPPEDNITRLVTFDIPEKERRKRQWLRAELLACGFYSLHKSVFIGKRPLPSAFIKNIHQLGLDKYTHIIGIEKSGTLNKNRK